jgi:hypothetical protein
MKVHIILSLILFLGINSGILSQKPFREALLPIMDLAPALPADGKEAFTKSKDCEINETVYKPFNDKVGQLNKTLSSMKPGDIDMNAYTGQPTGMPAADEIEFMQTAGNSISNPLDELLELTNEMQKIVGQYDGDFNKLKENMDAEIQKCPRKSTGEMSYPDEVCVKANIQKYTPQFEKIIKDYLKAAQPVIATYKTKIKEKHTAIEATMAQMKYGDDASMPTTKVLIFNIQAKIITDISTYGTWVKDVWTKACTWQREVEGLKTKAYY